MAWQDTLLDASFRGVTFAVDNLDDSGKRDVQRHAYPYVDGEDTEDLGRSALSFNIRAIIWGDNYEDELQTLVEALETSGVGELIHPIYGVIERAQVESWNVKHSADKRDYCTVQIQFLQDKPGSPFFIKELPSQKADTINSLSADAALASINAFSNSIKSLTSVKGILGRLNTIRSTMNNIISDVTGIVGAVKSSVLDLLEYPTAFCADLQSGLRSIIALRDFDTNLTNNWSSVFYTFKDITKLPSSYRTGTKPSTFVNRESSYQDSLEDDDTTLPIYPEDIILIESVAKVIAVTELADVVSDILSNESITPTLSPPEIEFMVNDVRENTQQAIESIRAIYPIEIARPITEPLKSMALTVQDLAISVIDIRPPLVHRKVEATSNLHLIAHDWYGDYTRAKELLRLNPKIRNPNHISRGDILNAYQR